MESLNLNMLASSLPNSNLANAEKDLMNNFKAAALSTSLLMIQQGVSAGESSSDPNGTGGMSIGRVMDYVEARLEAIKSREDEEDEDEERERKEKDRSNAQSTSTAAAAASANHRSGADPSASTKSTTAPVSEHKSTKDTTPLTPHTPPSFSHHQHHAPPLPFVPPSPDPIYLLARLSAPHNHQPQPRPFEGRQALRADASQPRHHRPLLRARLRLRQRGRRGDALRRRHAGLGVGAPGPPGGWDETPTHSHARRFVLPDRCDVLQWGVGSAWGDETADTIVERGDDGGGEAMDVEEEGRERKRVARR
ncbi:hypothetical protein EUX98_g8201 [Antrodiella citrinella]|uniref:Uncharacterized protein n=1 Tax=Antrodiella citrinella TaxID=2447956 RepID=A0A4S4MAE5_9APHY|nr:hypothetical protein EUX98_g8201 [Antrodiella citrinella]